MLRNLHYILIFSLFITGIINGQLDPLLTIGPENGHLIIAGATIQGSFLARGDTRANTIMAGDHLEGLSFINNVAIYDRCRWSAERDTTYLLPAGSEEFYFLIKGQRYDMRHRTVIR